MNWYKRKKIKKIQMKCKEVKISVPFIFDIIDKQTKASFVCLRKILNNYNNKISIDDSKTLNLKKKK